MAETIETASEDDSDGSRIQRLKVVLVAVPEKTKRVCAVVNKPMYWLSEESRSLVGYVGLITLFNATAVLIYKFLIAAFGG